MDQDLTIRIREVMARENLNAKSFSERTGIQQAALSHYLTGRRQPTLDVAQKILKSFRQIRAEWLLFGDGEMTNGEAGWGVQAQFSFDKSREPSGISNSSLKNEVKKEEQVKSEKKTDIEMEKEVVVEKRKIDRIVIFYTDGRYEEYFSRE